MMSANADLFSCSVLHPLALQNRALSKKEKSAKGAEKRGGRRVASKGGNKEKGTRENLSATFLQVLQKIDPKNAPKIAALFGGC